MSHRRLVQTFAFTVLAAVLAFVVYVTPARPLPAAVTIRAVPTSEPRYDTQAAAAGAAQLVLNDIAAAVAIAQTVTPPAKMSTGSGEPGPGTDDPGPGSAPMPTGDAREAIAAHFGDVYDQAVRVADCESSLNPAAVSAGGGNWGLFQINRAAHRADFEQFVNGDTPPGAEGYITFEVGTLNADLNAAYARKLYDGHGGWGPWACAWAA